MPSSLVGETFVDGVSSNGEKAAAAPGPCQLSPGARILTAAGRRLPRPAGVADLERLLEERMVLEGGSRKPDWVGRGIGLAVFCAGITLLILVFVWTSRLAAPLMSRGEKVDVQWAVSFGVQLVRLFVSGLVASWIAGRGAQLYAAANRALAGD